MPPNRPLTTDLRSRQASHYGAHTGPHPDARVPTPDAARASPPPPTFAAESQSSSAAPTAPADLVLTGGNIYTVDPAQSTATALAVKDGKIVFVGSAVEAKRWIGPQTKTEQLGGRLVLPGLIDAHLHPLDIVDLDVCNLDSKPMPLEELSTFVAQCLAHYKTPPGQRLVVHQWNYTAGNQPDPQHPTLRAALDAVSTKVEIQLLGNDAHHGAFNSLALAHATRIRAHYAQNPLIQANYIKLFADGVLEGDPYSVPPTLPNAAALKPFLQPIFAVDAQGHATVTGYVDTASPTCVDVRAHPDKYAGDAAITSFMKARGYHPAQCQISSGQLQHSREIILEYI